MSADEAVWVADYVRARHVGAAILTAELRGLDLSNGRAAAERDAARVALAAQTARADAAEAAVPLTVNGPWNLNRLAGARPWTIRMGGLISQAMDKT